MASTEPQLRVKSKGGAAPQSPLVGWVFIDRHRYDGYTVRWKRGDPVAYVLSGKQIGNHTMSNILATIRVLPAGWTDLAEIRSLGQRWAHQRWAGEA